MQITIPKYQNFFQYFRYTKIFRTPTWLIQRIKHRKIDSQAGLILNMRLGHKIELIPTQPYLSRVIWNRSYHDEGTFYLEPYLTNGAVILDIGANIGLLTCAYAERFKKLSPQIYAVEAVEANFNCLVRNVDLNGFKNINSFRLALGKEKGTLTFKLPSKEFMGNAVGSNVLCDEDKASMDKSHFYEESVELVTLDEWASDQNIERCDFVKIDVEGAELFVFEGGRNFIRKTRPIIQCEFNRYWLENQGLGITDFLQFFKKLDYEVYVDAGQKFVLYEKENFNHSLVDLLLMPKERRLRE